MMPERVTAFAFSGSTRCESLGTSLLLKNSDAASIRINGLTVNPAGFSLAAQLPAELEVGATLPVAFAYTGTNKDGADGTLTVATSVGCFDFRVRGLAGDDRVMTYSDRAIDFGVVPAGSTSKSHTVSILFQFAPSLSPPTVQGFSTSPEGLFEIVALPQVMQPASCEVLQVAVRFKAPATPGEHEGALAWRVLTDSAEGTVLIPLYATSR